MLRTELQQIFLDAAGEVLETMFFTGVMGENLAEDESAPVSAELAFHGDPSGRFGVRVPLTTARAVAASFLGLDEVSDQQAGEVLGELANMLCGSVLSRLEAGARFELTHPELGAQNHNWREEPGAEGHTFGLEEGTITLWMARADLCPVCPAA